MPKLKHSILILLAGAVWLGIGIFLMTLGIRFTLSQLYRPPIHFSILSLFEPLAGTREQASVIVLTLALFIGYLKGRFVLGKSVKRQVKRICDLPNPASLAALYSKGYYFLIGGMMSLGFILRFLPISLDTRGFIDMTIGSALINGSVLFFRSVKLASSRKHCS